MPQKAPSKVTGVKVTNLHNSARVTWSKISKISGYQVWLKEKGGEYQRIKVTAKTSLKITGLKDGHSYYVKICAYRKFSDGTKFEGEFSAVKYVKPAKVTTDTVHNIWYTAVLNSAADLTAVNSDKVLHLKAGTSVVLCSTTSGTSMVKYKSNLYYVKRSKLSLTGMKTHQKAYAKSDVTEYVNKQGFTSSKKYMIYVSAYTQHVYLFTGSKGNWKLKYTFACSTGKFSTQTHYGRTTICGKQPVWYFEGVVCAYYASMVWGGGQAFHTWATGVGWPASHGCIRIPRKYAIFIYNNVPVGTGVYVM